MSDKCHVYCEDCGAIWDIKCPRCNQPDESDLIKEKLKEIRAELKHSETWVGLYKAEIDNTKAELAASKEAHDRTIGKLNEGIERLKRLSSAMVVLEATIEDLTGEKPEQPK